MTESTWRMFCAIAIGDELRQQVSNHIGTLREKHPDVRVRWVREANLHLTIKFIGNVEPHKVEALTGAAARAVSGLATFPVNFENTGVFPGPRKPRLLWIGINDVSAGLARLYTRLEGECAGSGFPQDESSFRPHLTLARLREPNQAHALAVDHLRRPFPTHQMLVSELLVIRSQMSSKRSTYTVISRHQFGS